MISVSLSIVFSGLLIADAIMFVNGYRSYFFRAKTDQEKKVRNKFFQRLDTEWDQKT